MKSEKLYKELIENGSELAVFDEPAACWEVNWCFQDSPKEWEKYQEIMGVFSKTFTELLHQSTNDNFFWQYCNCEIYKNHYSERKEVYFKRYQDANEEDFIKEEKYFINKCYIYEVEDDKHELETFILENQKEVVLTGTLDNETLKQIGFSQKCKIKFLDDKQYGNLFNSSVLSSENPHSRIFKSINAFNLFESLKEELIKNASTILADMSFIFRAMHKDKFIYDDIKESAFRTWLNEEYQIDLDNKLKLYDYCKTPHKISNYGLIKQHYNI